MKDKDPPDNHDLLPYELAQQRKPDNISRFDFSTRGTNESGRFSIIQATTRHSSAATSTLGQKVAADAKAKTDAKAKAEEFKKTMTPPATTKKAGSSTFSKQSTAQMAFKSKKDDGKSEVGKKKEMTADNYRREYLKRKREREAILLGKNLTPKQQQEKLLKERKILEEETFLRVRARELMDQIFMWKREYGMGNHEATYIAGQIVELERQLNIIDPRYWP